MNNHERFDAQARRSNADHCPHCGGYRHRAKPSYFLLCRKILARFYRDCTGYKDHFLRDDAQGRAFLLALLVFGLSPDDAERLAPWISPQEMRSMRRRAARIEPTPANISQIIKLTREQLDKYGWRVKDGKRARSGILHFPACDEMPAETERKRKAAKIAARKRKEQEARAALAAQARDPRDAAVLAAIDRIWRRPGATAYDTRIIMDAMSRDERALFPARDASFRRAIDRMRDRFVKRGYPWAVWFRNWSWLSNRPTSNRKLPTAISKPFPAKSLQYREFVQTENGSFQGKVPLTETTDEVTSEGLADDEVLAAASPEQPASQPVVADRLHQREQALKEAFTDADQERIEQLEEEIKRIRQKQAERSQNVTDAVTTKRNKRSNR